VRELNDEKIDIIQWSPDTATFVANSLSPVKPLKTLLREADHTALVTVSEKQLSLAIGKDGQNARLAAKLTSWRVDVTKPAEGEIYEELAIDEVPETVSPSPRRERSAGRHERENGPKRSRGSGKY
jgi:N utilization substance protein A